MSLLGVDVGTTGCKTSVFSPEGQILGSAYREYDVRSPQPGWAELDAVAVWQAVKETMAQVATCAKADPVTALAVSSMGEAMVPVGADRRILGPSLLLQDVRGEAYLPALHRALPDDRLYAANGNTLGNHYSLTKLMWIRDHRSDEYRATRKYLLWGSFVSYMLGAEPLVDYSLANRTLLFDLHREDWSPELCEIAGLDPLKLPGVCPSGTVIVAVAPAVAAELGLPAGAAIVAGAHDQCANAVGCGVVDAGLAVYGMGTILCITPVFTDPPDASLMIPRGLNTEHHAAPGRYVSFIYNQGGALVKWFRNTFAGEEHRAAQAAGVDVYPQLFAEMPEEPSSVTVLPLFSASGPPSFIADAAGVVTGLRLETTRGAILKGIVEGTTFYLRECVEALPGAGIAIDEYRAVGGGSKSDAWIQLSADILGRPFVRPQVTEAGALGAAIIAGVGAGVFNSHEDGVAAMVRPDRTFDPDPRRGRAYDEQYAHYRELWPRLESYLRGWRTPTA